MRTSTILSLARDLISDEARWHKGGLYERGAKSLYHAKCVCAVGAIEKVTQKFGVNARLALDTLELAVPNCGIANYNDAPETTHNDILLAFDAAIGVARAEGK